MARNYTPLIFILIVFLFFRCAEDKILPPPQVYFNMPDDGYEVDLSDTLILTPKITYDYDTHYEWYENGELISTERELPYYSDVFQTKEYQFRVLSDRGDDSITITVHSLSFVTFEELELADEDTFWICPPDDYGFSSKIVSFPSDFNSADDWRGFLYSNKVVKNQNGLLKTFSAYPGIGAEKSEKYMIFHQDDDVKFNRLTFENNENHLVRSMQVVNTTSNYYYIKNTSKLDKDDLFVLTINGYNASGILTGTITFNLYDYTNTLAYLNQTWTTISLEELGYVNQIELMFSTISSHTDESIPGFVSIDNIKIKD